MKLQSVLRTVDKLCNDGQEGTGKKRRSLNHDLSKSITSALNSGVLLEFLAFVEFADREASKREGTPDLLSLALQTLKSAKDLDIDEDQEFFW